jgi:DNA mismatch repair protein MutS
MSDDTPMMQQYRRIKSQHGDAILFFRLGDFYEMFHRDAREVSKLLNLTLTKRHGVPMCGIPYHAANSYIPRLLRAGKKIAICEQTSLPDKGKGIVDREVVEIVTPGTVTEEEYLDRHRNNYLVSVGAHRGTIALCYVDISTGECAVRGFPEQKNDELLREELSRLEPTEILIQESLIEERPALARFLEGKTAMVINRYPDWSYDLESSISRLKRFFGLSNLKGFGFKENDPALVACGVLFEYIEENSRQVSRHIRRIQRVLDDDYVGIDEASQKNLEITANMNDRGSSYTLLEVIDHTRTAMGARELRSRILHPLRDLATLEKRLNLVETLYKDQVLLSSLRSHLGAVRDLERLTSRVSLDKAHAKDLTAIKQSLQELLELKEILPPSCPLEAFLENGGGKAQKPQYSPEKASEKSAEAEEIDYPTLRFLVDFLEKAIHEDPSIYLNEGRLIRRAYNEELDALHHMKKNSRAVLNEYLEKEKAASGIQNLKIKYNKIIGHFLEVTKSHTEKVPDHFIRRQSLVGSERYTTDRLNELEEQLNNASEQIIELERELFLQVREKVKTGIPQLLLLSKAVAALDTMQSLAYAATIHGWQKPRLNEGRAVRIREGRHPVVEMHEAPGSFVPNSVELDSDGNSFALITGPNMSGKSTFLRQVALIVLLSQIGSYVPAEEAEIGLVDRIFCRVGASDNLARGESTFLVEMNETAYILNSAGDRSLVIMDEVGRGTSTHDGLSIAWAVSEYLIDRRCKTLFATHYHELTALEKEGIRRLYLDVKEDEGRIVFLKKVRDGSARRSYGLYVAKLAGLPEEVLVRAGYILQSLEEREHSLPGAAAREGSREERSRNETPRSGASLDQSSRGIAAAAGESLGQSMLFSPEELIEEELRQLDLNNTTPLQALQLIARWRAEIEADRG